MKIKKTDNKAIVVRIQIQEFHDSDRIKSKSLTVYEANLDHVYKTIVKAIENE